AEFIPRVVFDAGEIRGMNSALRFLQNPFDVRCSQFLITAFLSIAESPIPPQSNPARTTAPVVCATADNSMSPSPASCVREACGRIFPSRTSKQLLLPYAARDFAITRDLVLKSEILPLPDLKSSPSPRARQSSRPPASPWLQRNTRLFRAR